jgi:hypothetical protein
MSDDDQDFDNQDDATDDQQGNQQDDQKDGDTSDGAADDGQSSQSSVLEEQLRTLQSERDKERARANKAEKALTKMEKDSAKDAGTPEVPPQVEAWITAAQTNLRDSLYKANPEFERHGLDSSLITGDTPEDMEASAKSLSEFVSKLEGNVRDSVLKEHGFDPEPRSTTRQSKKNWTDMDSKEFDKYVEEALKG